ncbi:MAG TPA: hypothetical protein EYO76_10565 [Flavobacteriaceae bacterium]|nr:hypothetical protein [Flavobacteriaceae bacterium]
MGGEGSMMAANNSLKNNRSMLSKRNGRSLGLVTNSNFKTEYNLPKATPEDIKRLRNKLQQEQRLSRIKSVILFLVIFILLIALLIFLNN